jgi:uncharacterized protein
MIKSFLTLSGISIIFLVSCNGETETDRTAERETRQLDYTATVEFIDDRGNTVSSIEAAVADDDASRTEGLMDVHDLPDNAGMIFIFEGDEPRSFWMANTPLPLDIIFVNSDMEIVRIHRNTAPYSQENILSEEPAKYAVEVNAGYTMRHDIREGMSIRFQEQ